MTTAVADRPKTAEPQGGAAKSTDLTVFLANKYGLERQVFINTVMAVCFSGRPSNEDLCSFLLVCKEYDLNPILREIYAFPKKGGGIQVIVGVDGWLKIANRHPAHDGMEFQDALDANGNVAAIKCRIYRTDRTHAIEAVEYLAECRRNTDPWKQMPLRMLRVRAICQAVRIAYGVSGVMNQDEFERWQELTVVDALPQSQPRRISRSTLNDRLIAAAPGVSEGPSSKPVGAVGYVGPEEPHEEPEPEQEPERNDYASTICGLIESAVNSGDLASVIRIDNEHFGQDSTWTPASDAERDCIAQKLTWAKSELAQPAAKSGKKAQKTAFETTENVGS